MLYDNTISVMCMMYVISICKHLFHCFDASSYKINKVNYVYNFIPVSVRKLAYLLFAIIAILDCSIK